MGKSNQSISALQRHWWRLHSDCGGRIISVDEPKIGPVLFCRCSADDKADWFEKTKRIPEVERP